MALDNIPAIVIYGSIISVVSFILHTIGFSTKSWLRFYNSTDGTTRRMGLWKTCYTDYEELQDLRVKEMEVCDAHTDAGMIFLEVLECMVLIAFIAAMISNIYQLVFVRDQRKFLVTGLLNLIAGIMATVGVMIIVIATITFAIILTVAANKFGDHLDGKIDYSFGLCIGGAIGGVISGILFLLAGRYQRGPPETDRKN